MPKGVLYNYYPDPSYIKKGWKPEQIPAESLQALANAEVTAVRHGVLSPNVAQQFLPNALVEGRSSAAGEPGDFGLNGINYPRSPELDQKISLMGLKMGVTPPPESDYWGDDEYQQWANTHQSGDVGYAGDDNRAGAGYYSMSPLSDGNARLAAVMLSHKAKLYGEDKAIERWNGQGPGALNHARKVGVLSQMLNHPANRAILDAYLKMKYPE